MTYVTDVTVSGTPAEFDPFSDEYFHDPYDLYRRMRDEAPVYFNEKYGFWALFRYERTCAPPTRTGRPSRAVTASTCPPSTAIPR
jgi:hypothetical protein